MTSLDTLRVAPPWTGWLRCYYEAVSETLFDDMPAGRSEQQRHFLRTRKSYVNLLVKLECFIEVAIRDPELKRYEEEGNLDQKPSLSEATRKYTGEISEFIRMVSKLSDRYEYNEHIQVFKDCCKELGLQRLLSWCDLQRVQSPASMKRDPDVFFELVRMIRARCLSLSILTAISQRRHDANERFKDYYRYIDACFEKHSRLVFIRIDLYYKKTAISDEKVAERANADLNRWLNNRRHNKHFRGWVGFVAKLEYGVQKGVHWHLLIWLDGRVRDGSNHIYLAKQFGEYWIKLTNGDGDYWNCNANGKEYHFRDRQGIGLIRHNDIKLRTNLIIEVLTYLTKTSQLLRPKFGKDFKTIRRGQYPKRLSGKKRGRKRKELESETRPD